MSAHTTWGAYQETLLHLYRSLIRSELDYGYVVYHSAQKSYLQMLDPIQNHALCLCLVAVRHLLLKASVLQRMNHHWN